MENQPCDTERNQNSRLSELVGFVKVWLKMPFYPRLCFPSQSQILSGFPDTSLISLGDERHWEDTSITPIDYFDSKQAQRKEVEKTPKFVIELLI